MNNKGKWNQGMDTGKHVFLKYSTLHDDMIK
jgi:hypothetical protein